MVKLNKTKHITKKGVLKNNPISMNVKKERLKAIILEIRRSILYADSVRMQQDIVETKDGYEWEFRDWGNWYSEPNDDGDYEEDDDFEVLDDNSRIKLNGIIEKYKKLYPKTKPEIYWDTSEKNWITLYVKAK